MAENIFVETKETESKIETNWTEWEAWSSCSYKNCETYERRSKVRQCISPQYKCDFDNIS